MQRSFLKPVYRPRRPPKFGKVAKPCTGLSNPDQAPRAGTRRGRFRAGIPSTVGSRVVSVVARPAWMGSHGREANSLTTSAPARRGRVWDRFSSTAGSSARRGRSRLAKTPAVDGFRLEFRPRSAPQSSTSGSPARRSPPRTGSGRNPVHGTHRNRPRRVAPRAGARRGRIRAGIPSTAGNRGHTRQEAPPAVDGFGVESRPRRGSGLPAADSPVRRGRVWGKIPSTAGKRAACSRFPRPPWTGLGPVFVHGRQPRPAWTVPLGENTRRGRVPRGIPSTERIAVVHVGQPRAPEPAVDGFGPESRPRREADLLAADSPARRGRLWGKIPSTARKRAACSRFPRPPWTGLGPVFVHGRQPRPAWTVPLGENTRCGRVPRGIPSTERIAVVHVGQPRAPEPGVDGFGTRFRPRRAAELPSVSSPARRSPQWTGLGRNPVHGGNGGGARAARCGKPCKGLSGADLALAKGGLPRCWRHVDGQRPQRSAVSRGTRVPVSLVPAMWGSALRYYMAKYITPRKRGYS